MKSLVCSLTCLLTAGIYLAETPPVPSAPPSQTFTIDSKILNERRRINVYMPPSYSSRGETRFPVLYMPDGGMAEDFPHVTSTVQSLITEGVIRPFIVVGIENTERRRDLTGPTEVEEDKKIAVHVGGSAAFRKFIRDELMPQVRSRYRVTDETAIVGESLAGLFVVETFLLEPGLFDTYIAIDPSVWWNHEVLVRGAAERLKAQPKLHKTLYLTTADEPNIVHGTALLAATLQAGAPAGLVWFYQPMPDQHHSTIFRASEAQAYRTVFGAPSPPARRLVAIVFPYWKQLSPFGRVVGHEVCVDFFFFLPAEMAGYLKSAGFEVEEIIERDPYPEVEHQSRRAYIFARKPRGESGPDT